MQVFLVLVWMQIGIAASLSFLGTSFSSRCIEMVLLADECFCECRRGAREYFFEPKSGVVGSFWEPRDRYEEYILESQRDSWRF